MREDLFNNEVRGHPIFRVAIDVEVTDLNWFTLLAWPLYELHEFR